MTLFPKRRWAQILLLLVLFLLAAGVAGAHYMRTLILTGGNTEPLPLDAVAATGATGMVVGTTGAQAQEIGAQILKDGGNAMDAALATAMGQITLAAGSWVSFAGILELLYYDAETGEIHNLNTAFSTVRAESDYEGVPGFAIMDMASGFKDKPGHHDGRTVPVPGFFKGVEAAHQRFGALPWPAIFAPVIELAEEGFEVNAGLARQFAMRKTILSKFPETRAVFFKRDGQLHDEGDQFRQPQLAATLKKLSADGNVDHIYTGAWAEKTVTAVKGLGGRMTLQDLASYQAMWVEPLTTTHNSYTVVTHGLPAYGGVNLIEALNLIEAAGLHQAPHFTESADSMYWLSHITRGAMGRDYYSDPESVDAVLSARTTKAHAQRLWEKMQAANGFVSVAPDLGPKHSDGVVTVDADGNMVALLHTINTVTYGETGLVIDGISIPDALTNQLDVARATTPGARLPSPTAPTLVFRDGEPVGAFSTIGAGLHPRLVTVLHGVLDHGMTPGEALNQPGLGLSLNFGGQGLLGKLWGSYQTLSSGALSESMVEDLDARGLDLVYNPSFAGYVVGITIDPESGLRHGGSLDRIGGRPVGY